MNEQQFQIPLLEVKLPVTGMTIKMSQWLTTGQSRELQKILLEGGHLNPQTQQLENLNTATFLVMQDKAAEFLLKECVDKDNNTQPATLELLSMLPQDDGNLVYEQINEIINKSAVTEEGKKK